MMFDGHSAYLEEEAQITAYASVACLTAFIFDCMLSIGEEVNIYQRGRLSKPVITYSLARLTTAAVLACSVAQNTAPSLYSESFAIIVYALWWISSSLTSLLFFFRVRAVFSRSPKTKFAFLVLWVLTTLAPIPLLWSLYPLGCPDVGHRGNICNQKTWSAVFFFLVVMMHDTLVFVYVSYELSNSSVTGRCDLRTLATGNGLHNVSKLLLRTGQLYYGATVIILIIATIALLRSIPFYIIFVSMHQVVSCVLACRVFRMVLLCDRELGPKNGEIRTAEVEAMVAAAIAGAEVTNAV
ncbi:hypothetical protein FIBSPDRAFT_1040851 [Athelia psychrophila]|uniref:DUF6533 domain-containing protein n=1 Tax=Athelia psychrophila TaxID=1759441 RepID=A0A166PPE1_9AGAM|nr:hypothetical protein FIBSPDRAFT_1040851 [Fibularhizoctonia sp. CBS 109695]